MPSQIKTYKFKLSPTKEQKDIFGQWLGVTRYMYNLCFDYKQTVFKANGSSLSKNDIQKELKEIKNETPWMNVVHSQVVQDATDRLFNAYDNFFRRVKNGETPGFPKFARKSRWTSFKFKQGVKIHPNTNRIFLPKIGKVKFRKSQDVVGDIKTCTIRKEHDGWYACLCCELNIEPKQKINKEVGLDLGIKELVITSDGEFFENPRTLRIWSERLELCQRNLSRKKKGSNNWRKNLFELQKLHAKIKRIRHDNLHKISSQIINENQVIICEKLNVKGMMKTCEPKQDENGKYIPNGQSAKAGLNKSIADSGWSMFVSMLEYKAAWNGRTFIQVAPHHTSQDCSECGYRHSDLTLKVREWTCPKCDAFHERDVNAARNILAKGKTKLELKEAGCVFSVKNKKNVSNKTFGDMVEIAQLAEKPHQKVA